MFEKILVCLDGSRLAEQILPYATEQALRFASKVLLLQVISPGSSFVASAPGIAAEPGSEQFHLEQMRVEKDQASSYLEGIAQGLRQTGLDVEVVVYQGTPGETIVAHAEQNQVGLIAIATHGRSGLRRLVFGSVANFVLKESSLPILLVKPQETSD